MEQVDRAQRGTRALRGTIGAAVATTVAATAHTLSGGTAPPLWLLLAVTLLAAPVAVACTGRRPSLWRTSTVVAISQLLLHVAFATVGATGPGGAAGHVHGTAVLLQDSAVGGGTALAIDPLMAAGHALAAVVTILLISHGERAVRTIAAGLRELAARIAIPSSALPVGVPALAFGRAAPIAAVRVTSLSGRGPPALAH